MQKFKGELGILEHEYNEYNFSIRSLNLIPQPRLLFLTQAYVLSPIKAHRVIVIMEVLFGLVLSLLLRVPLRLSKM